LARFARILRAFCVLRVRALPHRFQKISREISHLIFRIYTFSKNFPLLFNALQEMIFQATRGRCGDG